MAMKSRTIAVVIAFAATPLFANNHPAPQMVLALFSILPLMAILTAIGGGYAVRARMKHGISTLSKTAGVVVAIVFAAVSEGYTMLVVLIFAVLAIIRAVRMIAWGIEARNADPEGPLRDVKPRRMITSGVLIFPMALILVSMALAFLGAYDLVPGYRVPFMRKYVAYRLALRTPPSPQRSVLEEKADRELRYYRDSMGGINNENGYRIQETGSHFVVYLLPNVVKFPFPPYDRWFSAPSYRADDSGAIRMVYVHSRQLCPANAPIVDRVSPADIQSVLDGHTDVDIEPFFTGKSGVRR